MVDAAVQLAKDAKGRKAHPREEALILVAIIFSVFRVELPDVAVPVGRRGGAVEGALQLADARRAAVHHRRVLHRVLWRPGDARAEKGHLQQVLVISLEEKGKRV